MGKKLAIRGHSTRGKEVIELLEMMCGKNIHNLYGNNSFEYYVSGHAILNDRLSIIGDDDFVIFNLEEFLEKFPYKVGDKVVYTKYGDNCDDYPVTIESMKWTGTTIEYTFDSYVTCLAKDLKIWNGESDTVISGIYLNSCDYADEVELNLGDYEIEVRDGKTYAVKKKPKYPTTYEECWKVRFEVDGETILKEFHNVSGYYSGYLSALQKLLCCRDAYWKIAGEEMGLGKPWEPAVQNTISGITRSKDEVEKYSCRYGKTRLLEFPTIKMRDAFYENFKDLIESCKELL